MSDPHAAQHHASDEHHEEHPHVNYMAVFGALCALTLASVIADTIGGVLGKTLVVLIVLVVASFKAMFVMLYFMHLKFEGKWKYVLLAPTTILALAIIAALMPDIGTHYYDVQVPQMKTAPAAHHGGDTEPAPGGKH
jgi:cytochrome c oxidase subunit IV